jgi:hypothetical protein
MPFGLVEYWEIVLVMEVASMEFRWRRSDIGERPEVEIRMRVFIGFTKHPSGAPMVANWSQWNCKSASGTQAKTLSTYPWRFVTRVALEEAICGSFVQFNVKWLDEVGNNKGCKNGRESGQPWLTISSMSRVHNVPSAHLWWIVVVCL